MITFNSVTFIKDGSQILKHSRSFEEGSDLNNCYTAFLNNCYSAFVLGLLIYITNQTGNQASKKELALSFHEASAELNSEEVLQLFATKYFSNHSDILYFCFYSVTLPNDDGPDESDNQGDASNVIIGDFSNPKRRNHRFKEAA